LARRRWPAPPCLPLDDDLPHLGLAGLSALGGGRQGGLGQDGGHLLAAGGGRPGDQLAGSRHQCCLAASLIDWEMAQHLLLDELSSRSRCGSRGSHRLSGEEG